MTKRYYEQEWRDAGYPKGMGSAKFLPPPDRNFLRAYHLTSAEHGISSISLRRLKFARFSEANDPFELMALNSHKREIRQLLRRFKASQNSKMGLLCFSKNWTDPLLWSHYATKRGDKRPRSESAPMERQDNPRDDQGFGRPFQTTVLYYRLRTDQRMEPRDHLLGLSKGQTREPRGHHQGIRMGSGTVRDQSMLSLH